MYLSVSSLNILDTLVRLPTASIETSRQDLYGSPDYAKALRLLKTRGLVETKQRWSSILWSATGKAFVYHRDFIDLIERQRAPGNIFKFPLEGSELTDFAERVAVSMNIYRRRN
jgi:hypothetical protein